MASAEKLTEKDLGEVGIEETIQNDDMTAFRSATGADDWVAGGLFQDY